MTTAEERYEETWNSYLVLLDKDPKASLTSFTKSKSVYYRGMKQLMSRNGLSGFFIYAIRHRGDAYKSK